MDVGDMVEIPEMAFYDLVVTKREVVYGDVFIEASTTKSMVPRTIRLQEYEFTLRDS